MPLVLINHLIYVFLQQIFKIVNCQKIKHMLTVKLTDNIYVFTANDRRTHLFENLWPIENGVAYNSYLIIDEMVTLIDTVEKNFLEDYLDAVDAVLQGRKIDYLVINHMEPDHSAGIKYIVNKFPDVKIIGNKMTFVLSNPD